MASFDASIANDSSHYIGYKDDVSHLEFWDKIGLMVIGTTVVCVTFLIVVCTVGPGCCIHSCINKSAKSKSDDKKYGKHQTGSKNKHHSKPSLSDFDVTPGKFQKNRNEKNIRNQARSTEVSSRNGVKGHINDDITNHNYSQEDNIDRRGLKITQHTSLYNVYRRMETTTLNGITFGYGTQEELCDTHKNGNTSSEIILDEEEVNEEDEDVGPLARHRRLERASSNDSTASFWSNMSVTHAISNISSSLSRVLSSKDRERFDSSQESGHKKDRGPEYRGSKHTVNDSTSSSMVDIHTNEKLKKSPKQNSAKIILSFQLTRKIDSSIEDSSDANPEARQEKKIHFSEDIPSSNDTSVNDTSVISRTESSNTVVLTITVEGAEDLPPREYSSTRDPFVKLSLVKDTRRSLRKKTHLLLTEFTTRTVRHSLHPSFNETFTTEFKMSEFKNMRLTVSIFDHDRHTKITEIANAKIPLKDVKLLIISDDPIKMSVDLNDVKQELGEVLLGLTYLPTAQRLSFSIVKATNLKYNSAVDKLEDFRPYIRILQVSSKNGKVIRKKKTAVRTGTIEPEFNETLHFDLQPTQVETMIFLVMLSHRSIPEEKFIDDPESASDSTGIENSGHHRSFGRGPIEEFIYRTPRELQIEEANRQHSSKEDVCLGKFCLGQYVQGEKEKTHFLSVLLAPRKVLSVWHTLG